MKAAIYARFSTDRQDEASIDDQIRVCTEHAKRCGFHIVERFDDQGISGAAIGNRPGVQKLIDAALTARIDAVIVTDLSRLSRSQADLPKLIDRLSTKGVRVIGVQDGYDSTRKGHKLQAGLAGIIGEAFRDMVKERTGSALRMRAEQGYHAGGSVFGYDVVPADGKFFRKQIDPEQAKVVREIFDRYARGESMKAIVSDLNARNVPSAGAHWKRESRRKDGRWLVSALHAILHNDIYIGRLVYGTRVFVKDSDSGKREAWDVSVDGSTRSKWDRNAKARVTRAVDPPTPWVVREDASLAIIDRPLWDRVQARLGANVGAAEQRAKPRYLLSGLLTCGVCGSKMIVTGGEGRRHYVCGSYHGGGEHACSNSLTVLRTVAEELLVAPVLAKLEAPVVDATVAGVRSQLKAQRRPAVRRTSSEVAKANARLADLERFVAAGVMTAAEAAPAIERARAAREAAERGANGSNTVDLQTACEEFKGWVGNLRRALQGADVSQAREAMRQVGGAIVVKPHTERGVRRALKPHETLDGKGIGAGTWEERYLIASFTRMAEELPLHAVFAAEWFRSVAAVSSIGSGGRI